MRPQGQGAEMEGTDMTGIDNTVLAGGPAPPLPLPGPGAGMGHLGGTHRCPTGGSGRPSSASPAAVEPSTSEFTCRFFNGHNKKSTDQGQHQLRLVVWKPYAPALPWPVKF